MVTYTYITPIGTIKVMVDRRAETSGVTSGSLLADAMNGTSTPLIMVIIIISVTTSADSLLTFR